MTYDPGGTCDSVKMIIYIYRNNMVEPYAVQVRSNRNKCLQALNWPMQHVGVTFLLNESDFFFWVVTLVVPLHLQPLCANAVVSALKP